MFLPAALFTNSLIAVWGNIRRFEEKTGAAQGLLRAGGGSLATTEASTNGSVKDTKLTMLSGRRLRGLDSLSKGISENLQLVSHEDLGKEHNETAKPDEQHVHTFTTSRIKRFLGVPVLGGSNSIVQTNKMYRFDGDAKPNLQEEGYPLYCSIPSCDRRPECQGAKCCKTVMFEALLSITDWMDNHAVEYVLLHGTLLGAKRDKDIIPWTSDLDIGISAKDVQKLIQQNDIPFNFGYDQNFVIPRGCEDHNPGFPGEYQDMEADGEPGSMTAKGLLGYYIDIYPFEFTGDEVPSLGCLETNQDGAIRKTTVDIRGRPFKAPENVEACLVDWFGETWKIPTHQHANDVV